MQQSLQALRVATGSIGGASAGPTRHASYLVHCSSHPHAAGPGRVRLMCGPMHVHVSLDRPQPPLGIGNRSTPPPPSIPPPRRPRRAPSASAASSTVHTPPTPTHSPSRRDWSRQQLLVWRLESLRFPLEVQWNDQCVCIISASGQVYVVNVDAGIYYISTPHPHACRRAINLHCTRA